jgi:hypothetical protein
MLHRQTFSLGLFSFALLLAGQTALAQPGTGPTQPWGISSSASSLRNHGEWFPRISAAGVTTVRLFPEWRSVEPRPDSQGRTP